MMARSGSPAHALDWNDVRYFLAVARERTLARAAAALAVDQTTVGRRIASLEGRLRVALFTRSAAGFQLSEAGLRVLEAAERMEEAALEVSSGAADEVATVAGTVRIATTESLAEAFVVPALQALQKTHPRVHAVVATGWTSVDLRKGEADLAVRLVRPSDPRLACRKLGDFALRLYASKSYVARHGMPATLDGQALLSYDDAVRFRTRHPFANLPMERGRLALLANSQRVLLVAARAGLGIVQLPEFVGDAEPELVRVFPTVEQPYSVWLVVTQANRRIATVRAVSDAIAEAFSRRSRRTAGARPLARARS